MDGIYEHLDELTARQQELFRAAEGHIALSRELVTIKTDIPFDTTADDMVLDLAWTPEVESIFKLYEFPSLIRLVRKIASEVSVPRGGAVSGGSLFGSGDNVPGGQPSAQKLSAKQVPAEEITDARGQLCRRYCLCR